MGSSGSGGFRLLLSKFKLLVLEALLAPLLGAHRIRTIEIILGGVGSLGNRVVTRLDYTP